MKDDPRDARASRSTFERFTHSRRRPAHPTPVESGNRAVIIFLTVCTRERKKILANNDTAEVLVNSWQAADHWSVGRYIILPDHLHLFCAPGHQEALPMQKWVAFWKSLATRNWPRPDEKPIWQVDCWDTQLRRGENYDAQWEYVRGNAVRHGLADRPEDWPYQGELNILDWHDR